MAGMGSLKKILDLLMWLEKRQVRLSFIVNSTWISFLNLL